MPLPAIRLTTGMPRPWLLLGLAALAAGPLASQPVAEERDTVSGTVVDERGSPVAGVEVVLRPYPSEYQVDLFLLGQADALPEASDHSRSGPDGSYSLSAPRPGPYLLEFRPPAAGAEPRLASPLVYGSLVPLKGSQIAETVELPNLHPVAVRVLDPAGQPVEGAQVVADPTVWVSPSYLGRLTRQFRDLQAGTYSPPQEQQILPAFYRSVSQTDAEGIARFRLPTEDAVLVVSAPGFVRGEGKSASGRSSFRLERDPGVRLRVRAPNGTPAPGVLVRTPDTSDAYRNLGGSDLLQALGTPGALGAPGAPVAITDASGEAVVARSAAHRTTWELEGPGHALARVSVAAPATEEAAVQEQVVDVRLESPRRIPGRVVDTVSGLPIHGAAIWEQTSPGRHAYSGPTGAFDLNTPPERSATRLQVAAGGYLTGQTDIAASEDPNPAETQIGLTPESPIRGVVTDASGAAIEGATIRARPRDARASLDSPFGSRPATSAADGSFRVEEVVYGHAYRLIGQASGYANTVFDLPPLEPGVASEPVHLVLTAGRRVLGTVVNTEGDAVAGADVALLWPLDQSDFRSPFDVPAAAVTTSEEGMFAFPAVAAGGYELRLRHPEYADRPPAKIDVPDGASDLDLGDLTVVSGGTIHGIVADADGEPVAGASIQARGRRQVGGITRTATTDGDGRFRLDGLSTDLVDLGVRGAGYPLLVRTGVRVNSESPVRIELLNGGVVTGRVVDAGGNGAASVPVRLRIERDYRSGGSPLLWGPQDMFPRRVTDSEGRFRFDELAPGAWSAEARKGTEAAKVEAFELGAGAEREIELVLGTPDRLTVIVTTPLGEPVAGAQIRLESPGERLPSGYGRTDVSGRSVVDITPGPAIVKVSHDELRDESRQLQLEPGNNEVHFRLRLGVELSGTVRSYQGTPLALATVEAETEYSFNAESHRTNTVSDQNGTFRITGLEPRRYILTARSTGYADGGPDEAIEIGDSAVDGIEIVLEPEASIVGAVTGLSPADLSQVQVYARKGPRSRDATRDTDGSFSVRGIGPGTWQVRAVKGDWERTVEQTVTIEPGMTEVFVELPFERGLRLSGQVFEEGAPLGGTRLSVGGVSVRTDREGRFTLEGLEPGPNQVVIRRPDFSGSQYQSIDLQTDLEGVRIELEPAAATVAGVVVDAETSQPLDYASLMAADAATIGAIAGGGDTGRPLVGVSSVLTQAGRFKLDLRANADYLWVTLDGYESAQVPLNIAPGEHREGLVIRLQPAHPDAQDQ
ncbi:MAG: hypothetical protein F4210_02620 [Holophagales bacterium]|nr:hypothetical protein [Holophagales bacterium]MYF94404.1 hypothetical protein [Holophagales bacterium]